MRPHEEEWEIDGEGCLVAGGQTLAVVRLAHSGRGQLITAAPDMARALKAFLSENNHTPDCGGDTPGRNGCSDECAAARSALTKAGVL